MQVIEELTPLQQGGAVALIVLLVVFLVVAVRRRRAAAAGGEAQAATVKKERRLRGRKSGEARVPRRQRRKLAAEAAMSMGVDAATEPVEMPSHIVVPPVPQIEEPDPVAVVAETATPARAVVVDDPYVSDMGAYVDTQTTVVAEPEAASDSVLAPGWPAPGELSAGFDPDAFDPLPEVQEPAAYGDDQPTGVIAHVADDDDFDPATGWADPSTTAGGAEEPQGDLDHLWGEPEDEPTQWEEPAEETAPVDGEIPAEPTADAGWDDEQNEVWSSADVELEVKTQAAPVPQVAVEEAWDAEDYETAGEVEPDTTKFDAPVFTADEELAAAPHAEERAPDFTAEPFDPSELTVQTPSFPEPMYKLRDAELGVQDEAPLSGIALGGNGSSGPVVLDIAALAAAGHPVELVIEPNADGNGVRVRIGPPAGAPSEVSVVDAPVFKVPVEPEITAVEPAPEAATPEVTLDVDGGDAAPVDVWDAAHVAVEDAPEVAFLTGGTAAPAEQPLEAVQTSDDDVYDVQVTQEPVAEVIPPVTEAVAHLEVNGNAHGADDEPARILADIRARLAALDTQRDTHAF